MEHLFKLKKDGKTVGYLKIEDGYIYYRYPMRDWICNKIEFETAHPFVTKDKNGKDVFADDEVLVYKGNKNIGEGHIFFNTHILWWTVNNSNQDNNRIAPQDWSQLSLCDVDIELIKEEK